MSGSTMVGWALALLAVPVLAHPGVAQEAEILAVVKGTEDATNARDWTAFGSYFSSEGDLVLFDSRRAVGPEAVGRLMSEPWASQPTDGTLHLVATDVRLLTPTVALVNIEARFEASSPWRDRSLAVIARSGDRWMIEALRILPPGPAR